MSLLIPRGFSVNLVLLIWSLFGGILVHGLLANFRSMLLSTILEKPLDTADDILNRGLIPFASPFGGIFVDILKNSPNPVYQQLAEIFLVPKTWEEYGKIWEDGGIDRGTHVYLGRISLADRYYYWSTETLKGETPYNVWVVNKKWPLNDEMAVHLLIFQQVCIIMLLMLSIGS